MSTCCLFLYADYITQQCLHTSHISCSSDQVHKATMSQESSSHSIHFSRTSTMATGGGPPKPSAPTEKPHSDQEEEESAPAAPSLLCVVCTRELQDPHLLGCLHYVCKECLESVEEQDGRLKCSQCGDTSTHPPARSTQHENLLSTHCRGAVCSRSLCVSGTSHWKLANCSRRS